MWVGALDRKGYGAFKFLKSTWKAHRLGAAIVRPFPVGALVCHHCDEPRMLQSAAFVSRVAAGQHGGLRSEGAPQAAARRSQGRDGVELPENARRNHRRNVGEIHQSYRLSA